MPLHIFVYNTVLLSTRQFQPMNHTITVNLVVIQGTFFEANSIYLQRFLTSRKLLQIISNVTVHGTGQSMHYALHKL